MKRKTQDPHHATGTDESAPLQSALLTADDAGVTDIPNVALDKIREGTINYSRYCERDLAAQKLQGKFYAYYGVRRTASQPSLLCHPYNHGTTFAEKARFCVNDTLQPQLLDE